MYWNTALLCLLIFHEKQASSPKKDFAAYLSTLLTCFSFKIPMSICARELKYDCLYITTGNSVELNALIVLFSYHHKNTDKISKVIAPIIGAETVAPQLIEPVELSDYGLVGFGSGIYFGKHHRIILEFVDKLSQQNGKKAFISPQAVKQAATLNFIRS